ncbi:exopolysaccharide biosynthesis protein [Corticibacterium sp. UT-5YL-CI-8]|nr:exopolysaccharide biosynthesis protein [Tianweitania sp. UT-5YL-CI-8]
MTDFSADDTVCGDYRRRHRLSQMFSDMAERAEGAVTLGHIRDMMGHRAFAPLLTLFAAFNLMPLPPGTSIILGIPLLIVSAQMAFGTRKPWLPNFIARRSISAEQFRTVTDWIVPRLMRVERMVKPRYWPFWRRRGERIVGIAALILATCITLPIPLGNWLPAFATALLGLSLTQRDGILFALGTVVAIVSLGIIAGIIGTAGAAAQVVMGWL